MRAAQIREFGPPDVLRTAVLDDPVPAAGEALIAVEYAGITFVETQLRAGRPPFEPMRPQLPVVLGNGVAGVVVDVGPDVSPDLRGARVTSSLSGRGGYAELAVADAHRAIRIPDALGPDDAVALVADGRTALTIMAAVGDVKDRTVLVNAAGGGVGGLLVQLLTAAGARVIAAAGSDAKLARAAGLGATVLADYSHPSWPARVREQVDEVDIALDGVGGELGRAALSLVRPGGTFSGFGAAAGDGVLSADGRPDVHAVTAGLPDPEAAVRLATDALDRAAYGRLRPTIGAVFGLDEAAAAHAAIESRSVIGKTLLRAR